MKVTKNHKDGFNYTLEDGAVILQCDPYENKGKLFDHGLSWDIVEATELLHALKNKLSLPTKCFPHLNQ